ncbi:MAG: hypothetical protein N3A69_17010, partial [Leptospiraceae bacterium]|nr:hypothetical protein [Leptospiraceae bacterium]
MCIRDRDETAQKRKKTCERNLKLYANSVVEYCKAIDKKTGTENFLDCFLELGLGTIVGDCDCLVNGYCD